MSSSEEIKKIKKKEANKKYSQSEKGKQAIKKACTKYQKCDKHKEYKRQYYLKKKAEKENKKCEIL